MNEHARTGVDEDGTEDLASQLHPLSLLEGTPECLVVADADGRIVFVNHHAEALTGFGRAALIGRAVELLVACELLAIEPGVQVETVCRTRGGELPVEVRLGRIEGHRPLFVIGLRDASEIKAGREARFEAEAKYRSLVEQIPAVVYIDPVDEDSDSIYVSPQVVTLLGVSQQEWLSDPYSWRRHVHPDDIDRAWQEYQQAFRDHSTLDHEYRMVHEDGTVRWVLEQAYPVSNERGEPWLIQGVIFDISARKAAEEQVTFLAYHDKLTGLPNRMLFEEMLESAISRARRHDLGVGVIFLDLDNFKLVNDSLGHAAGDSLLAELGERLRVCTRESDLVARQGGDEFLVLLADLDRSTEPVPGSETVLAVVRSVAARIHEALSAPFDLHGTEFIASGSLGISLFPQHALEADTLLKNADAAMYQSKRQEPGGSVIFASTGEDPGERLSFTTRLRRAVEHEHWVLHYQPVVHLLDGSVEGVEALVRWRDPNGGIVPPGEFIPLAEELGLIEAIGDWVIGAMAAQQRAWADDGLDLTVGFNLSPRQLWSAHLSEKLLEKLRVADVDPSKVVVEITESTAMADPDRTQKILAELHAWGISLAIDDFGTGYSSLARLKHLPADILKIDRSFVRDVHLDAGLASMVRAMIQLASGLDMTPLAEGIETAEELEFLRANGCSLGQGFLFAKAVPADRIPELVTRTHGLLPEAAGLMPS
ncbi:MAG TPA: EAL domain-containing protein [Actinomycetota bacterium]|nr:EAL domain-containing protein [Actinomycetota bacterium]